MNRVKRSAILLPGLFCITAVAHAGAPYVTDDPETPDPGKWEVNSFVEGTHYHEQVEGEAGFDIAYGVAEDLQVTVALAAAFEHVERTESGLGDAELGLKYRFLHQQEGSWIPDVAFYPSIGLPTGAQRFSANEVGAFLPLWAQKDIGAWSIFGGGGYAVNSGDGNRDYWLASLAVTRQITDKLNIGGEIYHQTADEIGGDSVTGVGIGMILDLSDRWSLRASIGPLVAHDRLDADAYTFFLCLTFAN